MFGEPVGRRVRCPECETLNTAVVPRESSLVDQESAADGKVQTKCRECETQFTVHFRVDESDSQQSQ